MIGPSYRNQKLRDLASQAPHCMCCWTSKSGQIVGAHSNRIADGKGKGIKAHDLLAYVCQNCHTVIDGPGDKTERHNLFLQAFFNTTLWLLNEGHLEVKR